MQGSLLQPDEKRTGITFDPRTKMFLLLTVAVFVLGGAGGKNVDLLAQIDLNLSSGQIRTTHHRHCKFPAAGNLRHLIPVPARNHAGHVFD